MINANAQSKHEVNPQEVERRSENAIGHQRKPRKPKGDERGEKCRQQETAQTRKERQAPIPKANQNGDKKSPQPPGADTFATSNLDFESLRLQAMVGLRIHPNDQGSEP